MEQLWIIIAGLFIGITIGGMQEKKHYKSIRLREEKLKKIVSLGVKTPPYDDSEIIDQELVCGNVVISIDYFKQFVAGLRMIIGGKVISYESLVDRARREAILRMKEQAKDANVIMNVKIETSSISKGGNKSIGSIEALAYGTAIKLKS